MYDSQVGRPKLTMDDDMRYALLHAARRRDRAEARLGELIQEAVDGGAAPAAIARALGVSRQAVDQRLKKQSKAH